MTNIIKTSLIISFIPLGLMAVIVIGDLIVNPHLFSVSADTVFTVQNTSMTAIAYSYIGVLLAALASILSWSLPYLANIPNLSARKVKHILSLACGFSWLEYPLIIIGTLAEFYLLFIDKIDQTAHFTILALYGALWCLQVLLLQKQKVVGRIMSPRQQPVKLALIKMVNLDNGRVYATRVSDNNGRFNLKAHLGKYDIRAEKSGFKPSMSTVEVGGDDETRSALVLLPLCGTNNHGSIHG